MASWRERSHQIINERFKSIKATQPTLSDATVLGMISRNYYPFGERAMLPYKAWLQAMREWKLKLGVPVKTQRKKARCGCWFKGGEIETPCGAHKDSWQMTLEATK